MKSNSKISQFSSFLLRSGYAIPIKIWKWLKLLNSDPIIKKALVNRVYIGYWSSWLTFTVLQWMKRNFKISQFSRFLLMSEYPIQVKISKWLNLLLLLHSSRNHLKNQVYFRIWSFTLTFTFLQWMKTNFKISQFSRFLLRSMYAIQVKISKWPKLLTSPPFIKKTLVNQDNIRIWSFWLTFTVYSEWRQTSKLVNFQDFC